MYQRELTAWSDRENTLGSEQEEKQNPVVVKN